MDNYRPFSLLSSFSKILEKIVANRLCSYLDRYNLLSSSQFGFRTGHSTIHPMIYFTNHVAKALNDKEHTFAIFCDLRKAFATIKFFCLNSPGSVSGALPLNGLLITVPFEQKTICQFQWCWQFFADHPYGCAPGLDTGPHSFSFVHKWSPSLHTTFNASFCRWHYSSCLWSQPAWTYQFCQWWTIQNINLL